MTTLSLNVPRYVANSLPSISVSPVAPRKVERTKPTVLATEGLLSRLFKWARTNAARSTKKRMQMIETVSLGEKRFVALVQVDDRHFLIGGAPTNVGMLAEIGAGQTVAEALSETRSEAQHEAGNEVSAEIAPKVSLESNFHAQLLTATKVAAALESPMAEEVFEDDESDHELMAEGLDFLEFAYKPFDLQESSSRMEAELIAELAAEVHDTLTVTAIAEEVTVLALEPVVELYPANLASRLFYRQPAWSFELQGATS